MNGPIELRIPMPWGCLAGCWYGDQQIRPLLALHGWQDNAGSFARLAPLIASHRSILAIDLPGHGRSSHFPIGLSYHFNDFIRVIHRIVRHYRWEKISFIGHSMGAALSFYYAAYFPAKVDMIIAIDTLTTPYCTPDIQIDISTILTERILAEEEHQQESVELYSYELLKDLLYRGSEQSVERAHCKHLLERSVRRSISNPEMYYFSRDSRVKQLDLVCSQPELVLALAERLDDISYLIIKAEHSEHLNEERLKDVFTILRAKSRIFEFHTLKGEKHHVHLNSPERVADCVIRFIRMNGSHGATTTKARL
ncbi:probable serine hydrolase isoform X2 [Eurosta solidaginis]|uniref:probable serine hydrolase isoform X2 n=1 Tax=Eurosta solidaginis TaxID=178769 RepID=UPI003530DFD1